MVIWGVWYSGFDFESGILSVLCVVMFGLGVLNWYSLDLYGVGMKRGNFLRRR